MKRHSFFSFVCASAVSVILLSGCGGGGGSAPQTSVPVPPVSTGDPSKSTTVDADVGTEFGQVRILAVNGEPAPQVQVSLPTTSAGNILATPVNQVIFLNRTADGASYFGGSDASGTHLIDPANVAMICGSSAQVGLAINGNTSRACAAPDISINTVTLPGTCSKDTMFYTWHLKTGEVLWFDHTSERKFTIDPTGLPGTVLANGGQINWGNYQGATVKTIKTAAGKASVTIDFGSNCVGAFGQMNDPEGKTGRLVDMSVVDGSTWLKFMFHSDKSGADGGSGWGSEPWLDTVSGYTVAPSVIEGYLNFNSDTGNYFVTIPDVPCDNAGNITAYRGTKQSDDSYVYDPGTSGSDDPLRRPFGLGWLPIQGNPNEVQLYTLVPDPSVASSFDRENFNLVIGSCN